MSEYFNVQYNIKYNCVIVLQSLKDKKIEKQTGEELYNDIISRRCEQRKIPSRFKQVYDREDFFTFMQGLVDAVINKNYCPILHFEMHGGLYGFDLASGESATWEELADFLRPINIHLNNQFLVTMAACKGISLYQTINPNLPAPFWGVIGPKFVMHEDDLLIDFSSFYDIFLESYNLDAALEAINQQYAGYTYALITCEMILEMLVVMAEKNGLPIPNLDLVKKNFLMK